MNDTSYNKLFLYGASTDDQKICDLGDNKEISIWYQASSAKCYLKNNTSNSYPININYFDGTQSPLPGSVSYINGFNNYYLDRKSPIINNQQLAISDATITLGADNKFTQLINFDYNNICVYNDLCKLNAILISVVSDEEKG